MKKQFFSGILALVLVAFVSYGISKNQKVDKLSDLVALQNVEALAQAESSSPFCYAGGMGSTSCSIEAGITIAGHGVAGGCSVSCLGNYYACCSLRCTCEKIPKV